MKIKKKDLLRIVKEEFSKVALTILEADEEETPPEEPQQKKSSPKKPELTTAAGTQDKKSQDPKANAAPPEEVPDEEDPADRGLDPTTDLNGEAEAGSGGLNDELSGKTVQSISIEAKSKLLPGAKEVVISFNETTDSLKILVTSTGMTKFYYRGKISDIP